MIEHHGARRLRARERGREEYRRHQCGDWGDVPPEDARENEFSVLNGFPMIVPSSKCPRASRADAGVLAPYELPLVREKL